MAPTPTLPLPEVLSHLLSPRQATATVTIIPTTSNSDSSSSQSAGGSSISGGGIAGIVIGTIVGLLLIAWIVRSLSGDNKKNNTAAPAPDNDRQGWYDDRAGAVHGRTSSRHRHHSSRSRSRDHHRAHRHHSRRSSTPRPVVVVDDKAVYGEPRRPSGAYVVPMGEVRRSRSQGRSRSPGYYARY